jgi:hypothetical protein
VDVGEEMMSANVKVYKDITMFKGPEIFLPFVCPPRKNWSTTELLQRLL